LGSHHGRGQDLGAATRIRLVPDERRHGVDDFGGIGAFAQDGGDLVRRHVVGAAGEGLDGILQGERDIAMGHGSAGIGHGNNATARAVIEARGAEHQVVAHLGFRVDRQIDDDLVGGMQGVGGGAGQSEIDPVRDPRESGRVGVRGLEVRGVKVS
jgi:hypothetical protein